MAIFGGQRDSSQLPSLVIVGGVLIFFFAVIQRLFSTKRDPREPPYLYPKIPIIGHLISLFREGADYFSRLEKQYHKGIYTLPIFNGRMYMVTSPEWAAAVHRTHKSLHFNTLVSQAMEHLFLMDKPTMEIVNTNLNGENGKRDGIMLEVHDMMFATLAPGPFLDDLNKSILDSLLPDVNSLASEGPNRLKLWEWIRHHFSVASVAAVWGQRNPFSEHPDVEPAFWDFEASSMPLMMMPYPKVLARKGYMARQRLLEAWEEYMENDWFKDPGVSQLIKNRIEMNMGKYGMTKKMYAYGDASLLFGTLLNTIPTAFWLISWIFRDTELLTEIRAEIDNCTASATSTKRIINATKLRTSCPLLSSAFRETLRLVGCLNINRYVAEDTTVTNPSTGESFLLRKDAVIQIAGSVIHFQSLWGSDATTFNPRRFMASGEKAKKDAESGKPPDPAAPFRDANGKVYSSAFRSFGGGNNICPGRHFAQTEILALASLFVAGFDIKNAGKEGYKMPPFEDFKLMMGVIKPGKDVEVDVSRRKGYEEVEWGFEM